MSVMVELCIFPMGEGESVSQYVSRAVAIIQNSGLDYAPGPMGTTIEGEWEETMSVVDECYKALEADCNRVYMILKVDSRKGRTNGLVTKMQSLDEKL